MRCRLPRAALPLAALLVVLTSWWYAADAGAYCRTRTCQLAKKGTPCPLDEVTGCYTAGAEVFWPDSCISYAIQRDGSVAQGITAEQLELVVDAAFRAWSDVRCPLGGTPPLTAHSQGKIACDAAEFNCERPEENHNIIVFRDDFVNTEFFRQGVIALTTITARVATGELFDADIEINSRDEDFIFAPTPKGSSARDLNGVLTHEIGHLLGLSHPNQSGALMYFNYQGTVLPAADDIAGICDIRRGATADPECSVVEVQPDAGCPGNKRDCVGETQTTLIESSSGCACRVGAAGSPGAASPGAGGSPGAGSRWAAMLPLALALYCARRRSRPAR